MLDQACQVYLLLQQSIPEKYSYTHTEAENTFFMAGIIFFITTSYIIKASPVHLLSGNHQVLSEFELTLALFPLHPILKVIRMSPLF